MKTLDQITQLASTFFKARDEFRAHHATKPKEFDFDDEDHVRWHIRSEKLVGLSVKHEMAYREACDEFFSKQAGDIAELQNGLVEYFDGLVDINSNGGPNTAMRLLAEVKGVFGDI